MAQQIKPVLEVDLNAQSADAAHWYFKNNGINLASIPMAERMQLFNAATSCFFMGARWREKLTIEGKEMPDGLTDASPTNK